MLPWASRLTLGDPGRSGRCRRGGGGGVESALRRLRWLGLGISDGKIDSENYVSEYKAVRAKEVSELTSITYTQCFQHAQ